MSPFVSIVTETASRSFRPGDAPKTSDEKGQPMKTNREFTRRLAALVLMLFAVAQARSQSGPDAFNPSLNGSVESLVAQPDGKVLVAGSFTLVANQYR